MGDTERATGTKAPALVHEETMCCGYKKCPTLRQYDDGSVEISDDDAGGGSVGTVRFQPEQARRLAALLAARS